MENQRRIQYGQPPYPPTGYGTGGPNATANPLKVCPHCGRLVVESARFCQYCGTAFTMTAG
jgi:predicted amidophosphoribosyltransferase